jgi:hypothetical protein
VPRRDGRRYSQVVDRTNLVRCDDDSATAWRRDPPASTFTLTERGEQLPVEHEARRGAGQRER